ncbi:unnamed protein product [Ceratitis capitata]|uniref:(Mediterranean fruit fly) hypothetical protein n=1 Tax=Ceratitis capitata TaxID=7213 RepID=A0A811UQ94_CERCA|nr:unnamed protein product [Ceratitis capitata]
MCLDNFHVGHCTVDNNEKVVASSLACSLWLVALLPPLLLLLAVGQSVNGRQRAIVSFARHPQQMFMSNGTSQHQLTARLTVGKCVDE